MMFPVVNRPAGDVETGLGRTLMDLSDLPAEEFQRALLRSESDISCQRCEYGTE